jgi:glycosyltransferase involved in cell wall biosynthesis
MISVVIATSDSERALVPTLAALVPGAMAGTIREVIVADAGSRDGTATVADVAGCRFIVAQGSPGARLKQGAASARAPWLMFLRPGVVPDATWIDEVDRFIRNTELGARAQAAVFRRAGTSGARPMLVEALSLLAAALGARPRPEQGLLIQKQLYDALGGHSGDDADPETNLLRRLRRHRIVMLRSAVVVAGA